MWTPAEYASLHLNADNPNRMQSHDVRMHVVLFHTVDRWCF